MAAKKKTAPGKVPEMEINDLETLKIITDPTRLAILESMREARSVTEIAENLDVPRTRLYHHIKLLEHHGLIRVASTRKKGALEEKLYEPAADSFSPGSKLMDSADPIERVDALIAGILDTTRDDLRRSLLKLWSGDQTSGPSKEIGLLRSLLRLTNAEAEQFDEDFMKLMGKYQKLHKHEVATPDTHLYALTFLFYPSSRDRN